MVNYKRYNSLTKKKYNRKGISYYLMRKKSDEFIIPYLRRIKNKVVLEAGIGYGYYKKAYFSNNTVIGYDVNPDMGKDLGIEIIAGRADEIGKINRRFDRILSFYMTEYLTRTELKRFIDDSVDVLLKPGGIFATTIIVRRGLGRIYTSLATMKGIRKNSYSYDEIKKLVSGRNYKITPLNTYFGVPMSVFLEIKK